MNNKTIYAGGGLVRNRKGEYLLIFRNGRWDLPKGKLEEGEVIEECAVREVSEECGLGEVFLQRGEHIVTTVHYYDLQGVRIEKQTWWYAMEYLGAEELVPQREEGIDDVRWVSFGEAEELLKNSYDTIREVFKKGAK